MSDNFGIIQVAQAPVRASASDTAEMVTQLLFGETLEILEQSQQWIRIRCQHDNYEGWMDSKQAAICDLKTLQIWRKFATYRQLENSLVLSSEEGLCTIYKGSLIPQDFHNGFLLGDQNYRPVTKEFALSRNLSIIEHAQGYLNTPYLWGGRSFTGLDCSGFTQMVYAFVGKLLPRDASQQVMLGKSVDFKEVQAGDLAFFKNEAGRIIHVGILTGQGTILHAHGKVTEDFIMIDGIYKKNNLSKSHDLDCIKRL